MRGLHLNFCMRKSSKCRLIKLPTQKNINFSEFFIIDNPLGEGETVLGLVLLDTHLVIYGQVNTITLYMPPRGL